MLQIYSQALNGRLESTVGNMARSQEDKLNMKQKKVRNNWAPLSVTFADCDDLLRIMITASLLPNIMHFPLLANSNPEVSRENYSGTMPSLSQLDIAQSSTLSLNKPDVKLNNLKISSLLLVSLTYLIVTDNLQCTSHCVFIVQVHAKMDPTLTGHII